MKRLSVVAMAAGLLPVSLLAGSQTIPIFENWGIVTNSPQVDARAFANYGQFIAGYYSDLAEPYPYDFQNVLNYTNKGAMAGYPGFRFDYTDDVGTRRWANSFYNHRQGQVVAGEAFIFQAISNAISPTHLFLSATNVINEGYMGVGNLGLMRIEGSSVNLARGALEVSPVIPDPFANAIIYTGTPPVPTYFWPDTAIYDEYWGTGIQDPPIRGPINTTTIAQFLPQGVFAVSPPHQVSGGFAQVGTFIPFTYFTAFARTNVNGWTFVTLTNIDGTATNLFLPTNIVRQAALVGVSDTNRFTVRAKFFPSFIPQVAHDSVAIELAMTTTNIITGQPEINALYFVDKLASETNLLVLTNFLPLAATGRPIAYEVWRSQPLEFFGANPNADFNQSFLYNAGMSNRYATNFYAGYGCSADFLAFRAPRLPGATVTNLAGRIEVNADSVDLRNARIRGMGLISINATHLIGSVGAKVDADHLSYNLASTNGLLTIQNLSNPGADRLGGELFAWSGLWTNQFALILSNWIVDPNTGTNLFQPYTNAIDVGIHCLILSADALYATQQVVVHDFNARATNVVLHDTMRFGHSLVIAAESLTVNTNASISLTNDLHQWHYTNTPGVRFFTNLGGIYLNDLANYGADGPAGGFPRFINRGILQARGHLIAADTYENSGQVNSRNTELLWANSAKLDGGREISGGDIIYNANDLKLHSYAVACGGALRLNVTNSLADVLGATTNQLDCGDGFHLLRKPQYGDLLGTRLRTSVPQFASVDHTWAAEDRGASPAGFKDNAAVGRLVVNIFAGSEARFGPPRGLNGQPVAGNYGLYVDYLELSGNLRLDPESAMVIEPGLTLYFGASNGSAEELDGKFEGRLRWVRSYAGPQSGVDVALRDGRTVRANVALVDSRNLDSDGDGLANGFDPFPFDGVTLSPVQIVSPAPFTVLLSWRASADTTYTVEYATKLIPANWQTLGAVTSNPTDFSQVLSLRDVVTNAPTTGRAPRFYRVRYSP